MTENELFSKAVAFATEKHMGQTRQDGSSYINHPLKVAELLKDAGYGENYQIAAVLHDTLEDTDATEDEIKVFGEDVLEAVRLVTRPYGMEETEYVDAILKNHMAAAVKNADKIHNMWDLVHSSSRDWAIQYAQKVRKYYSGKFSLALDKAIENALQIIVYENPLSEPLLYTKEDMELYTDK